MMMMMMMMSAIMGPKAIERGLNAGNV